MAIGSAGSSGKKIASAWVEIKPSFRNFYRDLSRQLATQMRATARTMNRQMAAIGRTSGLGFGRNFSATRITSGAMFSGLTATAAAAGRLAGKSFSLAAAATVKAANIAKVGLAVGAGVATAGAGVVAAKGVSRALNIEDARAKLKALKYDAGQIATITKSAMDSVVGTQYSFDAAMGASVQAIAAGIKEGPQLTSYLKLITDASVVSGAEMSEIGYIFNKIQSNTNAYAGEVNQLADRGLPVYKWLSQEVNMDMVSLRKAMKKGEISSGDFLNAVQKNIGNASQTAADTTRGWTANFNSSLGRLGAAAMEGSLPLFMELMKKLIPVVDAFTNSIKGTADEFWKGFGAKAIPAIEAWTQGIIANVEAGNSMFPFFDKVKAFVGIIKDVVGHLGFMKDAIMDSPFGEFIEDSIEKAINFLTHLKPLGQIWDETIFPAIAPFITIFDSIQQKVMETYGVMFEMMLPLFDMFTLLGSAIGGMFSGSNNFMQSWSTILLTITQGIVGFITTVGPALFGIVKSLIGGIAEIVVGLLPIIMTIVGRIGEILTNNGPAISAMIKEIAPLIVQLGEILGVVVLYLLDLVEKILPVILENIGPVLAVVIEFIKYLVMGIGIIINIISLALQLMANGIIGLINTFIIIGNWISSLFGNENPMATMEIPKLSADWSFMEMFDDVPKFATGGTILPTKGGTLGILAEAGKAESVVDTGAMNDQLRATKQLVMANREVTTPVVNHNTFTVENAQNMDEAKLRREWEKFLRRSGRTE